jgi:hypothetical protein
MGELAIDLTDEARRFIDARLPRVASSLRALIWPSIRLRTEAPAAEPLRLGVSKLGGEPDLPIGCPWPHLQGHPLAFIGQLQLADFAPWPGGVEAPGAGRLYFFYQVDEANDGGFFTSDRESWRVLYNDSPLAALERRALPARLSAEARFRPCALAARSEISLPPDESPYIQQLNLTDPESYAYADLLDWLWTRYGPDLEPRHRLLGHPNQIQGDMQLDIQMEWHGIKDYADPAVARLAHIPPAWRLLFQVDSDEQTGMRWGDVGRLYYWIRSSDLARARFDEAWMVIQYG